MILAELVHTLPAQLVLVEWGIGNGTADPAANEAFTSGWFDTWRLNPERVIQPKSGQVVDTHDDSVFGPGTNRDSGLYFLDVFCRHTNPGGLPLTLTLNQIMTPALMTVPFVAFVPTQSFIVRSSGMGGGVDTGAFFSRTFRTRNRYVRLSFTYPNSNPSDWYLSAVFRSV